VFIWSRFNLSVKQAKFLNPKYANFEYIVLIARIKTLAGGAVISITALIEHYKKDHYS
jgi:hypothetical protein